MSILKRIGNIYKDVALAGVIPPGVKGGLPLNADFGALSGHLMKEKEQHSQHYKSKQDK